MTASDHHKTCRLTDANEIKETAEARKRASADIPNVNFAPWIGKDYGTNSRFHGKSLLVLGESHYEWCPLCWGNGTQRDSDFTCRCVAELVVTGKKSTQHWRKIEYALSGERLDQIARAAFWHSVAYYNFVQQIVGFFPEEGGRAPKPTKQMWEKGESAFNEIIKYLDPDIVVVLGYTLWQQLPDQGPQNELESIAEDGKKLERYCYHIGRRPTVACRVLHPAAGLGATWYPVLRRAIAMTEALPKGNA